MAEGAFTFQGGRVWVAGHRGMVGSALCRRLASEHCIVLTVGRRDLDLRERPNVEKWMQANRPDAIFLAAATVGGILANDSRPAEFLYDNLTIAANVIHSAWKQGVSKLLFLGSSCVYPKMAPQPIDESTLLTGSLEPTNQWYAIAKISGIMLCQAYRQQYGCDFVSAMPTNLYGMGDNFDYRSSHVVPALMRKVHEAKVGRHDKVSVWGSGSPLREFLHVDDLADALVFLMKTYSDKSQVNVGSGEEISIRDLALLLADVVGYSGELVFDSSLPDGTPRKLLSSSRLAKLGWSPTISLQQGLAETYRWYLAQQPSDEAV